MRSSPEVNALIAAGDALIDDLSILLSEDHIEGIAEAIGLKLNEHMDEWEKASAVLDPLRTSHAAARACQP